MIYISYDERVNLYNQIEKIRGRPLICYVTSSRNNASANMASDVIPEFAKQILSIPTTNKKVDILIVSNGGDPTVSWRIISLLRERFNEVGVLLPYAAYSAATLLSLGADEILMHPFSNLGPVDPQLSYRKRNNEPINFGSEDLSHFIEFVRKDVGISDQEQLEKAFELICKDVGAIPIGVAKRGTNLALSMGEKLLSLHMKDKSKATAIAEALNKSFYNHGYPVGRSEAKSIGLSIIEPEPLLENLMWKIWENIETELECNKPFNPLEIIFNHQETASLLAPVPQIQLPTNLPPQIAQQAYNAILQQIQVISINPLDYEVTNATLESARCRSKFITKGKINAVRKPDMNIAVNIITTSCGWVFSEYADKGE